VKSENEGVPFTLHLQAHVPFEGIQDKPTLDIPATGKKVNLDEVLISTAVEKADILAV
jgi:hypothetical protein